MFDVKADPGEKINVAAEHPVVVHELDRAYDAWWASVQPHLVNEDAVGPGSNPFKDLYEQQFGKAAIPRKMKSRSICEGPGVLSFQIASNGSQ